MDQYNQETITEQLTEFIYNNFSRARAKSIGPDDKLLDQRVIDSLGLLELIEFIESTYEIKFHEEDVVDKNVGTINALVHYVQQSLENC